MATILLVDNDPLQGFLCKSILERRFLDVQRVRDAAEALCLVEQAQFAENLGLVISDLSFPGIGSSEFVAELHERLPHVPVLILGSHSEGCEQQAGGWVRFLSRPFADGQILAAVNDLLKQNTPAAA